MRKGFPTKYFFNTMYCTMYIAMLNIEPSTYVFQKNIVTTGQEKN